VNDKAFLIGMGLGMVAGGALYRMTAPKPKKSSCQTMMEKAIRGMEDVLEDVSGVLGK